MSYGGVRKWQCVVVSLVLCLLLWLSAASGYAAMFWGPYRGVNATDLNEADVRDLAATGANVIRLSFNKRPLMEKEPPYELNRDAFEYLDRVLGWAQKYNLSVVLDPHTTPGTEVNTTTRVSDLIWKSNHWHDHLARLWDYVAQRYKDRGNALAGYDLLNEPNVPRYEDGTPRGGPSDWNALVRRLAAVIRRHDKTRPIIIEPIMSLSRDIRKGRERLYPLDAMKYFIPPDDPYIVFSPHMYEPGEFSHQGVNNRPEGAIYPGRIGGMNWNKEKLRWVMEPFREVQQKYGIPIFIGEFSAPRWTGNAGNQYLQDLIELFEEYNWSWAYHIFRGADVWDPEKSNTDKEDKKRYPSTPRMELLRQYFSRNKSVKQ